MTTYLLSKPLQQAEEELYVKAMEILDLNFSNFEEILIKEMFQNKFKLSCLDAGLALVDPSNQARRKIFTMLAILEASPNYTDSFLARDFSISDYFNVFFAGIRAVLRAIIGVLMVKNIQRKCH